jgi:hypothetical protein
MNGISSHLECREVLKVSRLIATESEAIIQFPQQVDRSCARVSAFGEQEKGFLPRQ